MRGSRPQLVDAAAGYPRRGRAVRSQPRRLPGLDSSLESAAGLTYSEHPKTPMSSGAANPQIAIRELDSIADLRRAIALEKEVWGLHDADLTPLSTAIAGRAAGAFWLGAFDGPGLVGIAYAFPSLHNGRAGFHSHLLAVAASHERRGIGCRLKLAQRERARALGLDEISWTFDPLLSRNAYLNFSKLGVISEKYIADFYGPQTSSPLHRNGTDRLWVMWQVGSKRVAERLRENDARQKTLDALKHLEPLVRLNGEGIPVLGDIPAAISRQRIAIEIPAHMDRVERDDIPLARQWRAATRSAFTAALQSGFVVKDFCRFVRGQQGPGVYLLERNNP